MRFLSIQTSFSKNDFSFSDYKIDENDFSGNKVTGVPDNVISTELNIEFPARIFLKVDHYYCASLPLNDENSEYAQSYNLINACIEKTFKFRSFGFVLSFGSRNIFNEFYSSGNDLNAGRKRYYNPSPFRNYFAGLSIKI